MLCSHNLRACGGLDAVHLDLQFPTLTSTPPVTPTSSTLWDDDKQRFDVNKAALSFILSPTPIALVSDARAPATTRSLASARRPKRKLPRSSSSSRAKVVSSPTAVEFLLSNDSDTEANRIVSTSNLPISSTSISTPTTSSAGSITNGIKKGSKFCVVDGCMSRAKHAKRCWRHGGSVKCKVTDCANRAKSKGVCWSHGGGTLCSFERCDTISVSNGFCWAHGGGKRCAVHQCSKPAYERTQNYCTAHYEEHVGVCSYGVASHGH